jgi:regulator of protease activity HflC (stomatin/prohibitin superfamily)
VVVCEPGIIWYWPATTEYLWYPVVRQALVVREQTYDTTDGKTFCLGLMLSYEVDDIERLLAHTWEPDETIEEIALGIAGAVVTGKSWDDLKQQHNAGTLNRNLLYEARKALRPYGVKVMKAIPYTFAPCRVYKLLIPNKAAA